MMIIGCGNRDRGDDAAGILVTERLRAFGVPALICSGETSELIAKWSHADDVLVIDCVFTGAPPGTVHLWNADLPLAIDSPGASTHGMGLGHAIELSRALGRIPKRLRIYGVEGKNFAIGAGVTPEIQRGIEEVVSKIRTEVQR